MRTMTDRERFRQTQRNAERLKIADIRAEDFSDIDPALPTTAKAGSPEKVRIIAARYQAGLPLWDPEDDQSMRLEYNDDVPGILIPVGDAELDELADEQ